MGTGPTDAPVFKLAGDGKPVSAGAGSIVSETGSRMHAKSVELNLTGQRALSHCHFLHTQLPRQRKLTLGNHRQKKAGAKGASGLCRLQNCALLAVFA